MMNRPIPSSNSESTPVSRLSRKNIRQDYQALKRVLLTLALLFAVAAPLVYLKGSQAARPRTGGKAGSPVRTDDTVPRPLNLSARAFKSATKTLGLVSAPFAGNLYVDPAGVCSGNSPCYTTIQAAISAATAGDTINVGAGTYAEQINIDKALTLLGPNANIDPNTGSRGAEAIIVPTSSDPLNSSFTGPIVVNLAANGITFNGFTINGNNSSLTSGVIFNGEDVDAEFGLYGTETANPDAVVSNNIVKNTGEFGIWIDSNGQGGAKDANSRITNNQVDNILGTFFGQGIRIADDAWVDITNNVVSRVRNGIVIENYSGNTTTHPASVISNNTVTSYRIGIRHNLHYVYGAPGFTISNNRISPYVQNPLPPQTGVPTAYQGIRVESIQQTVAVTVSDNVLTGNRTAMIGGGYVQDEGLMLTNATCVSPNIVFNLNKASDFIRGVFNETPAVATFTCNQIRSNTTGFYLSSAATNGLTANNNDIAGNGFGFQNDGPATVNAQSNWWGAADGPGAIASGSGDQVSTNVDYSSFLTSRSTCADHAPVVTATAGVTAYAQCNGATPVDSAVTVTDADDTTLPAATVSITNNFNSGEDVLAFVNDNATAFGDIQVDGYSVGVLSLRSPSATATVAQWQNALRAVTYNNTAGTPNPSTRTVAFVVNDGVNNSNAATKDVSIAGPPPSTPTISGDTNGTGTQDQACPEQPLTLHANATGATSFQWYKDADPLSGETNQTYQAIADGTYYVTATGSGCTTPKSAGYVVQNPTPHSPFISFRGQASSVTTIAICEGSSIIIDSDSATGIQWYKDGVPIPGNSQSITATLAGTYTAQLNALGCHSQFGRNVTVTTNPLPPTPTITPGGPTTFCQGGSVTLTSSSASGNQWSLNGNPIGGATNQSYVATASGNYTVMVTDGNDCSSTSSPTSVTVNPTPATPTITPSGSTTGCDSVLLTSSSATGNQWYLEGNPIGGATNQTYNAAVAGNYSVVVTESGCASAPSLATNVAIQSSLVTVTSVNDSGAGSLRQALLDVCDNGTINFNLGAGPHTIDLTSAELLIDKNVTINGPGANLLTVMRSNAGGTPNFSNFNINFNKIVSISGLTISNGKSDDGGGIHNEGALTLNAVTISGNTTATTTSSVGGILNYSGNAAQPASLTITNSALSGNSSTQNAGAISNVAQSDGTAAVVVINSTISGNSSETGAAGGILNTSVQTATATVSIVNSTITENTAGSAGGIMNSGTGAVSTVKLFNTIVAHNFATNGVPADIFGPMDPSSSSNLIGDGGSGGLTDGVNSNQVGVADPKLGPLSNNGGPTATHALLAGSPAIDAGNNCVFDNSCSPALSAALIADQRGFLREVGLEVDKGAYETRPIVNISGPNNLCSGGTVTLNSDSPAGNQWYLDGNPIGGATGQTYIANATGAYTVKVTLNAISSEASLPAQIIPDAAPVLSYQNQSVVVTGSLTVNPNTGPDQYITSIVVQSPGTFAGNISVDNTGVVSVSDAAPAGTHTITIRATNNCGTITDATFNLTVIQPVLGNYPNGTVSLSSQTTITPSAAPSNASFVNVSTSTNFKGTLAVDPATGVVRVTNAHPAGTYNVAVNLYNGPVVITKTFTLTVQTPALCPGAPVYTDANPVTVGATSRAVAVADFNNDGKQDLAVVNEGGNSVSIRLGDGAGGFTGSTDIPVGATPEQIAVADFNNDGKLDLAVTSASLASVSIRLGDGAGGFTGITQVPVPAVPGAIVVGDFNGDGNPDLAVGSSSSLVAIRLGDGSGNFIVDNDIVFNDPPRALAVGDFNGDGIQDLAETDDSTIVRILLGDGTGTFNEVPGISAGDGPRSLAVGDFNGDGRQDLAVANLLSQTVSIRLADGLGGFFVAADISVPAPYSVALGDFNNDGKLDFAAASPLGIAIRLGDGAGSFTSVPDVTTGSGTPTGQNSGSVAIGDFNGDGKQDLVAINQFNNTLAILLGSCDPAPALTVANGITREVGSTATNSQIATVADLDTNNANTTGSVVVTVTSANPFHGVTISNIVNTNGNITANIATSCGAFGTATFTLRASDGTSIVTATLNVSVTPDTPPTLSYADQSVAFQGSLSVTPTTATDNGAIATFLLLGVSPPMTATINSAGVVSITNASLAGPHTVSVVAIDNCGVASVTPSTFTVNVSKGDQTITFGALGNRTFGDADFPISATATSGLPVYLDAVGNCTVTSTSPGMVHLTGAGSCTITASQPGNFNYNAAPDVPQSFTIAKAASSIAVVSTANPSDSGEQVTFNATATSGAGIPQGTVQFKDNGVNLDPAANLITSGLAQYTLSNLTPGTHTITADYAGDANYLPSSGSLAGGQVVRAVPSLSINDASISEGDSGTRTLDFTVNLSAASHLTVTVNFATANGTATAPSDYVATNGTLTFNPGDRSKTISVTINGDVNFEPDETFKVTLSAPNRAVIGRATATGTIQNDDFQGGLLAFNPSHYTVNESDGFVTVTLTRTSDVSQAATVDYATRDLASTDCSALNTGAASARCDYTAMFGTFRFAPNETQKTLTIPINRDAYIEGPETFRVQLSNPSIGSALSVPGDAVITINDSPSPTPNATDDTDLFVRQQYHDFLNREADAAGLAFWKNNIDKCNDPAQRDPGQTLAACIEVQRITTSAAFFLSIEFRQTGGMVRDFYVAALNRPATNNMPDFVEFMRDSQAIQEGVVVGQGNWQQVLDANRTAFMNDFVMRPEFTGLYPATDTPAQYVDKLYQHANVTPLSTQERTDAINEFAGAGTAADAGARARALYRITQNADFQAREISRSFVYMEYLGYLRRNPNDPPDGDFAGFNFWLTKLNQFNGDYLQAEMVKAFLTSLEYRKRFGL